MHAKLLLCVLAGLLAGCRGEHSGDATEEATREINGLLSAWQKSFEAKDVNGVMQMYAPGPALTAYDIIPPLQYKGADAYSKDYTEYFAQFAGPLQVQFRDQHPELTGSPAPASGLERITRTQKTGQSADVWVRYTAAFKKVNGHWRDIHDHISVPVDMNTGKAALDLKP
jgi:ketosteroid isomerase-like protein